MDKLVTILSLIDITEYLQTIINLSGTLLGLAFAAFIFVLQDGFQSFKQSRTLLLKLYVGSGKQIIYSFSYVVCISLIRLYFIVSKNILFAIHILFSFIFIKALLDYASDRGYIKTIHSTKYIPKNYGPLRAYFRKIRNLGFIQNIVILLQISVFVLFPIYVSYFITTTISLCDQAIIISIGLFLLFAIMYLALFIPNFLKMTIQSFEISTKSENPTFDVAKDIDINFETERNLLKKYLESREYIINNESKKKTGLNTYSLYIREDGQPEAWFNIMIENPKGDPISLRREIECFAVQLFSDLRESECDINSFVESFHLNYKDKNRNIFFRITRAELNELMIFESNPKEYISKLKNKLFDDLFRDM